MGASLHGANKPHVLQISSFLEVSLTQRYTLLAPTSFSAWPQSHGIPESHTCWMRKKQRRQSGPQHFLLSPVNRSPVDFRRTPTYSLIFLQPLRPLLKPFWLPLMSFARLNSVRPLASLTLISGWTDTMAVFLSGYTSLLPSSRGFIILRLCLANDFLFHNAGLLTLSSDGLFLGIPRS